MSNNEQPDYIFIECSADHSFEKNSTNNRWINKIDGGVTIPENAILSVQYAGLNVIGSDSNVIEFKNEKIGQSEIYKYNEENENYEKVKYDVYDNKITLFIEFYKNQDGLYNYIMPYPHFSYSYTDYENNYIARGNNKDKTNEEKQQGIEQSTYNSIFNYGFPVDNKRYTILKRNPNSEYTGTHSGREHNGIYFARDISNYEYSVYFNEVEIELDKGYLTPSSISQQISQQLDKHTEVKKKQMRCWINDTTYSSQWTDDYVDIEGGITTETETFKLFQCATRRSFYLYAYTAFNSAINYNDNSEVIQYAKNFEYIGCYNPSIFLTGRSILKDLSYDSKQQNFVFLNEINCTGETSPRYKIYSLHTNIPYNKDILKQFNYIFNYQIKDEAMYETKVAKLTNSTPQNSRFLHVDCKTPQTYTNLNAYKTARFGTDYSTSTTTAGNLTNPMYLNYYEGWNDFHGDGAYGVFFPWINDLGQVYTRIDVRMYIDIDASSNPYFKFYTDGVTNADKYGGTFTQDHFDYDPSVFPLITEKYLRIGWDRHFSAHGNQCIMLWNGLTDVSSLKVKMSAESGGSVQDAIPVYSNTFLLTSDNTKEYTYDTGNDEIYLGSDSFLFNFDEVESRFTMSQLHTSRKQFNNALSGFDSSVMRGIKADPTTGTPEIYYQNGIIPDTVNADNIDFPIDINPNGNTPIYEISPNVLTTSTQEVEFHYRNLNIQTNVIFDSNCGIYLSFWGVDDKTYQNSLWDILGFSQNQTHTYHIEDLPFQEVLYRSNRFLNSGVNLNQSQIYPFTTNCQINSNEIITWKNNPFNISYFNTLNIPNNFRVIHDSKNTNHEFHFEDNVRPYRVIQNQVSTLMYAERLPRKTNIPYYQIRSDILPMVKYYGGNKQTNGRLPVVSLVNKSFGGNDYMVNQGDNSMEFIITRRTTINSVTTEIFDSNGIPAVLDPHSCIIYKFQIPYITPQITPYLTSAELEEAEQQQIQKKQTKKK